jgi:hypothetical protein
MLRDFIQNEEEAKKALLGTILADGSIQKERYTASNKTSYRLTTYIEITHTSKNLDYLKEVKSIFEMIEGVKCKITEHNKVSKNKTYTLYRLVTNSTKYFKELRDILYDDKRIKLFPKGTIDTFNDMSLLLLYLDDGTLRVRFYENSNKRREARISFCLDSFTVDELNYFRQYLKNKYDIDSHIYRHSKSLPINRGFRVWLNTINTEKFMSIINKYYECVPSMQYKFTKYYSL